SCKRISICQEQYTRNLLKKYEISDSSLVKTLMVPPNNLGPDLAGKPISVQSKEITSNCCKKNPQVPERTPTLGMYYPKCSGFDLKGYSDSDLLVAIWTEKSPQVPAKYLVENWSVRVLRNSSQWLCPQLRLNMLLLLGVVQVSYG
ncbi:hypothetical protein Tco_0111920, partial [Tanacetum coccineum]